MGAAKVLGRFEWIKRVVKRLAPRHFICFDWWNQVTTIEYIRINCDHPDVETMTVDEMNQQFADGKKSR